MFWVSLALSVFTLALLVPEATSKCDMDILFVLDASSSVREDFDRSKLIVQKFGEALNIGPNTQQVALLEYSGSTRNWAQIPFGQVQSNAEFNLLLSRLLYLQGSTLTGKALRIVRRMLDGRRAHVQTLVIVITDGFSFDKIKEPLADIRSLPNVVTYALAVAERNRESELLLIAGDASRVFRGSRVFEDAEAAIGPLIQCDAPRRPSQPARPIVSPLPRPPPRLNPIASPLPSPIPAPLAPSPPISAPDPAPLPREIVQPAIQAAGDDEPRTVLRRPIPDPAYPTYPPLETFPPGPDTFQTLPPAGPDEKTIPRPANDFSIDETAAGSEDTEDRRTIPSQVNYNCNRIAFQSVCLTGFRSQFTLRWYYDSRTRRCCPYAWGYCKGEVEVAKHPSLKSKAACEALCP